jgi:hypothetical protein
MAWINLPRHFVVEFYCLARQAERSLDAVLFAPWPEFAAYYKGERASRVRDILGGLQSPLQSKKMAPLHVQRDEVLRHVKAPGLIAHLSGPYRGRWRKVWAFSGIEVAFVAAAFHALLHLLEENIAPAKETIVSLRMDFWAAQYLVQCRCHGMPELARATYVEHFNQAHHITPVKLSDLAPCPDDRMASSSLSRSTVVQRETHQ